MNLTKTFSLALVTLTLSGCSIIWSPKHPDAGMDAFAPPDAFELDANADAYVPPDANADAWVRPPEVCDDAAANDEDNDGTSNCNDADCVGASNCCMPSTGTDLPDTDIANWRGSAIIPSSGTTRLVDFGTFGHVRRNFCVPLAQGAVIDVALLPRAATGTLGVVLSPATAPSASGYLDELAVRVEGNELFVTRAGSRIALRAPTGSCTGSSDHYVFSPASDVRVRFTVVPGVTSGQPAVVVSVDVSGLCDRSQTIVSDVTIPLRDLVSTTDGEGASCDANRGLYLALEGMGARFSLSNPALPISVLECASPGNFSPQSTVLNGSTVASSMPRAFSAGGIGAPDLLRVSDSDWRLAYDGSVEPRGSELFGNLTTAVGVGEASTLRASVWNWTAGRPTNFDDAREPSLRAPVGGNYEMFFSRRVGARYELWSTSGRLNALPTGSAILTTPGCSYREPVFVEHDDTDAWILFRCDNGARSTVGRATQINGSGLVTRDATDLFGSSLGSVRALDAIRMGEYLALWVLTEERGGTQGLHFFSAESADFPATLAPYAGNPVLLSGELQEGCTSGPCTLQSFAVERFQEGTKVYLRFVFARSRPTETAIAYEFIARTQIAPNGLR